MKTVKTLIVLSIAAQLSTWIRGDEPIALLDTLPFVQRRAVLGSDYELLATGALLMGLWGILVLRQRPSTMPPAPASAPSTAPAPRQFRASLVLIPLTILVLTYLGRTIALAVRFEEVVGLTPHTLANRHLGLLCVAVLSIVVIYRILRTPGKENP